MDEAINLTLSNCPDLPIAQTYIPKLFSVAFSDPSKLAIIACEAARLSNLSPTLASTFYYKFCITAGFIGLLSSILALLAYSLKPFSATTFYYFRVISFLDFIYMLSYVTSGFRVSTLVPRTPGWFYAYDAWQYVIRFTGKSSHLLVLWLAFDRSVACSPRAVIINNQLGKRRFIFKVIAGIFAFALIYDIPPTYFDIRRKYFNEPSPETALAIASRILTGTEGALMLIFTTMVIVGLIRLSKRKRKLMMGNNNEDPRTNGPINTTLIAQIRTNQSLCVLQLCEGVPYMLTMVAVYSSYLTNFLMIDRNSAQPFIAGGSYEENLRHQWMFALQTYVRIVVITNTDVYSHGFHFYNYLAFSPKFRRAVIGYLRRKDQVVTVLGP